MKTSQMIKILQTKSIIDANAYVLLHFIPSITRILIYATTHTQYGWRSTPPVAVIITAVSQYWSQLKLRHSAEIPVKMKK